MPTLSSGFLALRWSNWPLALVAAVVVTPLAVFLLPADLAYWIAGLAVALVALTLVLRAIGRHTGGLLVAPALAVLFVMNIFPLLWSFCSFSC
jgi:multiple sugar transport system permease protein